MIGVVSVRNGRVRLSAGASSRAKGRSARRAPDRAARRASPSSRAWWWSATAPAGTRAAPRAATTPRGEGLEVLVRRVHEAGQLVVALRQRGREQLEVVDHALDVVAPRDQLAADLRAVARGGLEALEHLAQVLLGGLLEARVGAGRLVVEGGATRAQQDLEVRARVGVELGEHLVAVDVGKRVGHRDAAALGDLAGLLRARVERQVHVLQAGLGPHQDVGVAVDRLVLVLDLHRHDRAAVLELHVAHLADLHPGDVHRLPLARHDGLGGRQLGLDLVEVGADQRHPRGQVEALLGQEVAGDRQRARRAGQMIATNTRSCLRIWRLTGPVRSSPR